jgi:hypothetical protein
MNGTMARLLGLLAVASTLILGGCVAEAGEEDIATGEPGRPVARVESTPVAHLAGAARVTPGASLAQAAPAQVEALDPDAIDPAPVEVVTEDMTDNPNADPEPAPWQGPYPHPR